jgi:hypothetical protein
MAHELYEHRTDMGWNDEDKDGKELDHGSFVSGHHLLVYATEILHACCVTNHILNGKHMQLLVRWTCWWGGFDRKGNPHVKVIPLINTAFEWGSYNVIPYILSASNWKYKYEKYWIKSAEERYKNKLNCIDKLIYEIDFIQGKHIMSYLRIYRYIQYSKLNDSLKRPALNYISKYLDPNLI